MSTPYGIREPNLRNRLLTIIGITEEITDAVLELLKPELSAYAEYESAINWHTTCLSCAKVLDSSYQETIRAEKAEQDLEHYEEHVIGEMNERAINDARRIAELTRTIQNLEAK